MKIRPKDFDIMMGYLESDQAPDHAIYAWHQHSKKAAKYIKKLEREIIKKDWKIKELTHS